jgi:hypothetical protein
MEKMPRAFDYGRLTALLIEATKEQQRQFKQEVVLRTQAAAIRSLKSELRATRQSLQKLKAQLAAFAAYGGDEVNTRVIQHRNADRA